MWYTSLMVASSMDFQLQVPYRIRHTIGPWINGLADWLGQPNYHVQPTEYAGTAQCSLGDLETMLRADGFSWAPFSLYHRTPIGTRPHTSWTYRSSVLADRQLHVILFAQSSEIIDIYAHTEYNWVRHPFKHTRQIGIDRAKGAGLMRQWLDYRGIACDHESRITRRVTHLLERVRERLSDRSRLQRLRSQNAGG